MQHDPAPLDRAAKDRLDHVVGVGGSWRHVGIVNLAANAVLVASAARRLGVGSLCSPIVLPRSNRAGPQKGALGPLS